MSEARPARRPPTAERCYLRGDEDGGVDIVCRDCDDRGGMALAWYDGRYGGPNPYPEADVPTVHTIAGLAAFAMRHDAEVHGDDA